LANSNENSILYNFGGSSVNIIWPEAQTQVICPKICLWLGYFRHCDLFFLYINFGIMILFMSLPFKNRLTNSNENSILHHLRGSSLYRKRA
jgi:hypothetical protein